MFIKKILEYDYNYATYIVSDGKFDVRTLCMSVPLKSGPPQVGMTIEIIEVFVFEELEIKLIDDKANSEFIINSDKNNFV